MMTMVCEWREQLTDVVITSVDAPLVSPGLTFSPTGIISDDEHGQARPDLGWNFNLFNNAWYYAAATSLLSILFPVPCLPD